MQYADELAAVLRWVEETDRIALEHFSTSVETETKADGTPVTVADRSVERFLRRILADEFPEDGVLGEEEGGSLVGSSGRRWIIDPIDGTKNYARGVPVFGTLIALEDAGRLAAAVVSAPALGSRWFATRGGGAFQDGTPIGVSKVSALGEAHVCSGGLDWSEGGEHGPALMRLLARTARHRGFGDFWGHMLVAQGSMDVMVEFAPLALWDIGAPRLIVEEAGGRWTSLNGSEAFEPGPAVSTNGPLHDEVLAILQDG